MIKVEEYYSREDLEKLGVASFGRQVFISRKAVIAHPESLHLGDFVRIDAFCSIIGRERIQIGDHVHIGSSVTVSLSAPVTIESFSGIASGARLFTSDDDYGGVYLTGPTVPEQESGVEVAPIHLQSHAVIGANSVVLPGTVLEEGAVIGALSLVKGNYPGWGIYGGVPARRIKDRSNQLLARISAASSPGA